MASEKPKVQLIQPPNTLREKVGPPGTGGVDADVLARAEKVIEDMADNYLVWVKDDIANLQAACDDLAAAEPGSDPKPHLERLFSIAHDMKGQGGSFGYPLITRVGNTLCRLVENLETPSDRDIEAIRLHVDAMRLIIANRMTDDGGPEGHRLIRGLELVLAKI